MMARDWVALRSANSSEGEEIRPVRSNGLLSVAPACCAIIPDTISAIVIFFMTAEFYLRWDSFIPM